MYLSSEIIKNRKIRVAIVGCGRISKNHIDAIDQYSDNAEIVAFCDSDPNAIAALNNPTSIPTYISLTSLLEAQNTLKLDLVVLTTPSGLHSVQTIMIAQYGINVLTEKPMATNWHDGLAMVNACDQAGVHLFVVKQNRKNATVQSLKQAIEHGRFGKIYSVAVNVFWTRPQEYYDAAKWRGTWELDGGAFMNQASHYIDLMCWLVGDIESVSSYTATFARKIEAEDSGVAIMKWRNGAIGTLNVSMLTYPKNMEGSITILGEKGFVKIGGMALNKIEAWQFSDYNDQDKDILNNNYDTGSVYGFGHSIYYDNVFKTLQGIESAHVNGRVGLKSLELLVALYRSARDKHMVYLPLDR